MTTITVERVADAITVDRFGRTRAQELAARLPARDDATHVVLGDVSIPDVLSPEILAQLAGVVTGPLVVVSPGFGAEGPGGEASPAAQWARYLKVPVMGPDDRVMATDTALFAIGRGAGWTVHAPDGSRTARGRRQPEPHWQIDLAPQFEDAAHIPAGLWISDPSDPAHAAPLTGLPADPDHLLIVVGAPGAVPVSAERLTTLLNALPAHLRQSAALASYGIGSLSMATVRRVAAAVGTPLRVLHGLPLPEGGVHLDAAGTRAWRATGTRSVCAAEVPPVLESWALPDDADELSPGLVDLTEGWVAQIMPRGFVVRPMTGPAPSDALRQVLAGDPTDALEIWVSAGDEPRIPRPVTDTLRALIVSLSGQNRVRVHTADAASHASVPDDIGPEVVRSTSPLGTVPDGTERSPAAARAPEPIGVDDDFDESATVVRRGSSAEPPTVRRPHHKFRSAVVSVARGPSSEAMAESTNIPRVEPLMSTPTTSAMPVMSAPPTAPPLRDAHAARPHPAEDDDARSSASDTAAPSPDVAETAAVSEGPRELSAATAPATAPAAAPAAAPGADTAPPRAPAASRVPDALSLAAVSKVTVPPAYERQPVAQEALSAAAPLREHPDAGGSTRLVVPPASVGSTAEQRQAVQTMLGSRFDVASRPVAQLLAERPGMRFGTANRSVLMTALAVVRVFAESPDEPYDERFETCLAEGLRLLPTIRTVVVRGVPALPPLAVGEGLTLGAPMVASSPDSAASAPAEIVVWTRTGRRLAGLFRDERDEHTVVLTAHTRLRVIGHEAGAVPRLLLTEAEGEDDAVHARLRAVATRRTAANETGHRLWSGPVPVTE